nr:immunoglobulin heavy chain junction region [Macaca mulatta]MOW45614.1 immunoglobulin heavy chain junction region [Macaca mulatta]MOW45640.1 immunoglobulin heavy chain junction region [Macaca mulatta]MOW45658.1 immunoglobulin heavy chain junction region [Macaca mulatta]MOW45676.1 immunoglobulin heavy chain junction region [Macaca mulatta]
CVKGETATVWGIYALDSW